MKLILDPGQAMLAQSARDFANKHNPVDRQRALRDAKDELGYSTEVWNEMADLGWTGIPFPESHGGLSMGLAEAVLITESMGEALAPEPFISAILLSGSLIDAAGTAEQKTHWLTSTIDGSKRLAVAHQDLGSRFASQTCAKSSHRPGAAKTLAEATDAGWTLNGVKAHVIDGYMADGWIVAAPVSGPEDSPAKDSVALSLFLIPADREGVSCTRQWRIDSRNTATLTLDNVAATSADLLGEVGVGQSLLDVAIDHATVGLCGEMLGLARESFTRTLEYLKTREQFGTKIGTFQALQHRAAELFVEIELCKSVVMAAARTLDDKASSSPDRIQQVSNAKARCSDTLILVTNEALQMHGGVGMTDEYDIGLFMKRARVCELTFGDAAYHRNRFAEARGF